MFISSGRPSLPVKQMSVPLIIGLIFFTTWMAILAAYVALPLRSLTAFADRPETTNAKYSFYSTIDERLPSLPIGPVTSWFRALTFVDPDQETDELYSSITCAGDTDILAAAAMKRLAENYGVSFEDEKANARISHNAGSWRFASAKWRDIIDKDTELPNHKSPLVESDFSLAVPVKATTAMRTWTVIESLYTLTSWPSETIISVGFDKDAGVDAYVAVSTLVKMMYELYCGTQPAGATVKVLMFNPDGGPWSARLHAIQHATGSVVATSDNDDYLGPEAIRVRADILRRNQDLDYFLVGYISADMEDNDSLDVVMNRLHEQLKFKSHYLDDKGLKKLAHKINEAEFEESRHQFNFTRENTWYLGSIVGLPNLGVQRFRFHKMPYKDYLKQIIDRLRVKPVQTSLDVKLRDVNLQPLEAFRLAREKQDEEYLVREENHGHMHDWDTRCHNGWATGRKKAFENIPPPTIQFQGEDSAYNFMVSASGLNRACVRWPSTLYIRWHDRIVFPPLS